MSSTGYDTLVVAWGQISDPVGGWAGDARDRVSGSRKAWLNVQGVFQATALERSDFCEVRVQASLPKLLWGQNISTLNASEAAGALELLQLAVRDCWPNFPALDKWAVRRVDCTANRDLTALGGQPAVWAVLELLKGVRLRGRPPLVGDSGTSVSWRGSRGGFSRKVYSKYDETGQDKRAEGLLRVEVGAIGQQAIRKVLGLGSGRVVTLSECLEYADLPDRVTGRFVGAVDQVIEGVGAMKWMRAFYQLKAYAESGNRRKGGSGRAAQLLGYAFMVSHVGWAALDLDRQTEWRLRRDFQGAGVEVPEIDWTGFDAGGVEEDMDAAGRALLRAVGGRSDAEPV